MSEAEPEQVPAELTASPEAGATRVDESPDSFYLGRRHDPVAEETLPDTLDYPARDLTTHAVIVGMTGSGKTGLGIGLIEEAALDGIPSIIVDPKGDMGNLLLHFPGLRAESFEPWVDPQAAERDGRTPAQQAARVAEKWRGGLEKWNQGPERVAALAEAAEFSIYTPGSSAGRPLRVLGSLAAPPPAIREDTEALTDRVQAATAGLLTLLGIDFDPVQSRESILIATILQQAWVDGRDMDLEDLVRSVQTPSFDRLGVLDLETFFPSKDRAKLALSLNSLLASPSFAAWLEGEPLDAGKLLWTAEGKPRVSVISIAHLSDRERIFFVSLLLAEIVSWMRTQSGTSSLRALFYMDEVFGFFPPTAEPPTKRPMLTLLKQARAFGLGCVLATQNPVDLDYKGLANCGTWFLGRLQTERDKLRVLDGLASLDRPPTLGGKMLERADLDRLLSSLAPRVFLAHNVHADGPVLFQTRWVLSYLRGPLTRQEIRRLAHETGAPGLEKAESEVEPDEQDPEDPEDLEEDEEDDDQEDDNEDEESAEARVLLPQDVPERWAALVGDPEDVLYEPYLEVHVHLHFVRVSARVDLYRTDRVRVPLPAKGARIEWDEARWQTEPEEVQLAKDPPDQVRHARLSSSAGNPRTHTRWKKQTKARAYEARAITVRSCKSEKLVSEPDEAEAAFLERCRASAEERCEQELERLRKRYAPKIAGQEERVRKGKEKIDREQEQYKDARRSSWLTTGANLIGALFGRKLASSSNARRAGTSARAASRTARQKADVERAERDLDAAREKLEKLVAERDHELSVVKATFEAFEPEVEKILVRPRKGEMEIVSYSLLWLID